MNAVVVFARLSLAQLEQLSLFTHTEHVARAIRAIHYWKSLLLI